MDMGHGANGVLGVLGTATDKDLVKEQTNKTEDNHTLKQ
jgi:hypothetical protein